MEEAAKESVSSRQLRAFAAAFEVEATERRLRKKLLVQRGLCAVFYCGFLYTPIKLLKSICCHIKPP